MEVNGGDNYGEEIKVSPLSGTSFVYFRARQLPIISNPYIPLAGLAGE